MSTVDIPVVTSGELPFTWKTAGRGWGHPLHKLSQYIGAFPPSLAHYFIQQLSDEGQMVLDPFSGGGTTVLEALLSNRQAIASDAFYYAYILSHAKAQPMTLKQFQCYIEKKIRESREIEIDETELSNRDLLASYSPVTLEQMVRLRTLLKDDDSQEAIFTKGVICGVLHGPSKMFLSLPQKDTVSSTPRYVERYAQEHQLYPPDRDMYECAMNKAQRCLTTSLPDTQGQVYLVDSRNLQHIATNSIDLVVTSPPYLAVLDYIWNNWLRVWWLGRDRGEHITKSSVLIDRCLILTKGRIQWRNRPIAWKNGQLELGL